MQCRTFATSLNADKESKTIKHPSQPHHSLFSYHSMRAKTGHIDRSYFPQSICSSTCYCRKSIKKINHTYTHLYLNSTVYLCCRTFYCLVALCTVSYPLSISWCMPTCTRLRLLTLCSWTLIYFHFLVNTILSQLCILYNLLNHSVYSPCLGRLLCLFDDGARICRQEFHCNWYYWLLRISHCRSQIKTFLKRRGLHTIPTPSVWFQIWKKSYKLKLIVIQYDLNHNFQFQK